LEEDYKVFPSLSIRSILLVWVFSIEYLIPMQPNACAVRKVKDDRTRDGGKGEHYPPEREKGDKLFPAGILDIIMPALQVGSLSGMFDFFLQALSALARALSPL
jgi:hypothetical protein